MQRLQNDKSNLDFWSILSAFWSFHDLWHHRNNICSVNKSHWYFAPCCSTLVQKIFWDTLCETGWKLTQFQTGKQEVAEDHHHHKEHHYQNHRKSVVRCENCCPMTQNDNVLSANPRYLKKKTCQYTFIITAKAGRRPLNNTQHHDHDDDHREVPVLDGQAAEQSGSQSCSCRHICPGKVRVNVT